MTESPIDEDSDPKTEKHSHKWPFLAFLVGILCIVMITYVDFEILSPLILPSDPCYYHTHKTPLWVEFWYMHGGSNGHPEGNLKHLLVLIVIGFTLGHLIVRRVRISSGR